MAVTVASYTNIANWFVTTTPRSVTGVAWSAGDIVVVVGGNENANGTMSNPTNANLTFGAPKASSVSGGGAECTVYVWASAAAAGAQTGQSIASSATGGLQWGFGVVVLTGSPTGFANAIANLTEAAISRTVAAGSTGIYCAIDFNATNPPGKTPATGSGTAVERRDAGNTTNYAQYIATWEGMSAGTFSFGPNNYTSLQVAQCFIEITAPGGSTVAAVGVSAGAAGTGTSSATVEHPATAASTGGGSTGVAVAKIKHLASGVSAGPAGTGTSTATVIPGGGGATTHPAVGLSNGAAGTATSTAKVRHTATAASTGSAGTGVAIAKVKHLAFGVSTGGGSAGTLVAFDPNLILTTLRLFRIRAEDRTMTVVAEDRTLSVPPVQVAVVPVEGRTLIVRPSVRIETVEVP